MAEQKALTLRVESSILSRPSTLERNNMSKISEAKIARFIREEKLIDLEDRVKIMEIVVDYFGDKVDGNDVNKVLRDMFGR